MTEAQAIERIKELFPSESNAKLLILLKSAVKNFSIDTQIVRAKSTETTQANVRYYPLTGFTSAAITSNDDVIKIDRVDYNNTWVDYLAGEPEEEDLSEAV